MPPPARPHGVSSATAALPRCGTRRTRSSDRRYSADWSGSPSNPSRSRTYGALGHCSFFSLSLAEKWARCLLVRYLKNALLTSAHPSDTSAAHRRREGMAHGRIRLGRTWAQGGEASAVAERPNHAFCSVAFWARVRRERKRGAASGGASGPCSVTGTSKERDPEERSRPCAPAPGASSVLPPMRWSPSKRRLDSGGRSVGVGS